MEVYEAIRSRVAVRRFKPDPVPEALVSKMLRSARWAPSSKNEQLWHFIVVRDRDMLEAIGKIATSGPFIAQAPLAIAIAMDNAYRPQLDAGRALQQMELTAWSEGVGTCFVGVVPEDQNSGIKELLGIPSEMVLVTVLPFGYPEDGSVSGKRRKPLSQIAHSERFGQPYGG